MQLKVKPWDLRPVVLLKSLESSQSVENSASQDQVAEGNIAGKIKKKVKNAVHDAI